MSNLPENHDPFASFENPQYRTKQDVEGDKKKKQKILLFSLLGAGVALAVAILLLVFVFPKPDEQDPTPPAVSIPLVDKLNEGMNNSVLSATLTHKDGKMELYNKEDTLYIKGYEDLPIELSSVSNTGNLMAGLSATQDVGEVENLKDFGFDAPSLKAEVMFHDKSVYTFELGNATPDESGYYFREKDSKHVYVIDASTGALLLTPADKYISISVFDAPTSSSEEAQVVMRNMTLTGSVRNNQKLSFRLVTSEDNDSFIYYTYLITEPKLKGTRSTYASKLETFTYLLADEIVSVRPTAKELQEYGFANPYSVAEFTLAARTTQTAATDANGNSTAETKYSNLKTHTIKVGGSKANQYYVMIDNVPIIYLVNADDMPWVTLTYDELADSMLFLDNISTISDYTVTLSDSETTFKLTHDPSTNDRIKSLKVEANGKVMDTMNFRYMVLVSMDIQRYGILSSDVTGKPLKLTLTMNKVDKNSDPLIIKFYELSPSVYGAVLNNGERHEVKASEVNNFIKQYQNYLAGKDVLY